MQDAALFFRHLAYASFNRRRKYPLLSAEWQREVDDARSFIRHARSVYPPRTGADLIAALQASPYREIDIEPER
jgi:hypothetical protein